MHTPPPGRQLESLQCGLGRQDLWAAHGRIAVMWLRLTALALLLVTGLGGCGSSRAPTAPAGQLPPTRGPGIAPCGARLARVPLPGESGVYRAGGVYLSIGEDLGQLPPGRGPRDFEAIVTVLGDRAATLSVLRSTGVRMTLAFDPRDWPMHPYAVLGDGRSSVRFSACGRTTARFYGDVLFAGRGCARLAVDAGTGRQTMVIPIAGSLRGCTSGSARHPLGSSWAPFLGVACGAPNRITCDRIGIGVWAGAPASAVIVDVGGRLVTLSPPAPGDRGLLWQGYLLGEGPAHGALRVRTDHRRQWFGTPALYPRVRVTAMLPNGQQADSAPMHVLLHPGFG